MLNVSKQDFCCIASSATKAKQKRVVVFPHIPSPWRRNVVSDRLLCADAKTGTHNSGALTCEIIIAGSECKREVERESSGGGVFVGVGGE